MTQPGHVDFFYRYCNCGGILELSNPMLSTAELNQQWGKIHPESTGHKRVETKREAKVQGREWRRKERKVRKELMKRERELQRLIFPSLGVSRCPK